MSHADRDAVNLIATQLRNLTASIDRGEVIPTILSIVTLTDDDERPTGEYNVSVIVRPQSAPPFLCGIVSMCGPNGQPLACAYPPYHAGDHSWAAPPPAETKGAAHG